MSRFRLGLGLTTMGVALLLGQFSLAQPAAAQPQTQEIVIAGEEAEGGAGDQAEEFRVVLAEGEEGAGGGSGEHKLPEYWLGVMGEPTPEVLKAQLKIDGGLMVTSVVDDSPAAKAGLQPHDVLLLFADKPVNGLENLVEVLRSTTGGETDMIVVRGGEKTTLKISPEKRPADAFAGQPGAEGANPNPNQFQLRDIIINRDGQPQRVRVYAVRPGVVLGEAVHGFPKNTSISIVKENDGPAKIEVKQGDKSWSVTEETINELPEELRVAVQNALSGHARATRVRQLGQPAPPVRLRVDALRKGGPVRGLDVQRIEAAPNLVEKIDLLMQKIEKIEKELQSLKESKQ